MALNYSDRTDFDNANRGFVATLDPVTITNAEGRVIFDLAPYAYLDGECPDTVNPSLWRQAQLCRTKQGLFEVTDGIYQVRGLDLSNMTLVEGDTGVIVIDPLISAEMRGRGARAVPRAPRRPAGHRGDLHALARRPLRRGQGVLPDGPATCRSWRRPGSWSTRCRRTSTPGRR